MKKSHKFISIPLVLSILAVLILGGGAYVATQQQKIETNSTIVFLSPTSGAALSIDEKATVRWSISRDILDSVPDDFDLYIFLDVKKQGEENGGMYGIGDGWDAAAGSATWNLPGYSNNGDLKPGIYKITAYLQAQPKDANRLCAPEYSYHKECRSSPADEATMKIFHQITGETGWFSVASSTGR